MWTMSKELKRIKDYQEKIKTCTDTKEKSKLSISIASILNHSVKVEIRDIVKNIANDWGITPESLDIDYNTSLDHTEEEMGKAYNYYTSYWAHRGINDPFDINISISNPDKKETQSTTITSHVFDTEVQKDGTPLVEHMTFDVGKRPDGDYDVIAKFKDFPDTLITFQIMELITEEAQPHNDTTKAILSAVDDRIFRNSSVML